MADQHAASGTSQDRTHHGSHYIDIAATPWQPAPGGSGRMKILFADPASGMTTILFEVPPGGVIPFHEHPEIEQTYMLSGRLVDDQGECTAGNYVWREAGSRHEARAPDGAVFIAFFQKFSQRLAPVDPA
jgi:quercetin dioxygenase-like cupin family protein